MEENIYESIIRKEDGTGNNQLISSILNQTEILSFSERIPSFNEIFIRVVGEDANQILS